jgi:excisionase family DNA binding protein
MNSPDNSTKQSYQPRVYRINDACQLLQISRSHLYELVARGDVRLVKIGNRSLIPASEILRLSGTEAA